MNACMDMEEPQILNSKNQIVAIIDKKQQEIIILSETLTIEVCPEEYGDGLCKKMKFKGGSFIIHIPKRGVYEEDFLK